MEKTGALVSAGTGAMGLAEISKLDQIVNWIPDGIGKIGVLASIVLSLIMAIKFIYEIRILRKKCSDD